MTEGIQPPERSAPVVGDFGLNTNEAPRDLASWIVANDASIADFVANESGFMAEFAKREERVSRTNVGLALHQLEFLRAYIWAGLDPVVHFCIPGLMLRDRAATGAFVTSRLKIACDEYTVKGSRLIMRRSLAEPAETVSLSELAKEVFNPQSDEYGDYRRRLRDNIASRMQDIGLWNVVDLGRQRAGNGNEYHGGYEIGAGPVLLAFHQHIYEPYSIRLAKLTCDILSKKGS